MIKKLVIATRNPAKVEYYRDILTPFTISLVGLNELNVEGKPDETGETAEQNAEIKARYYSTKTGLPVFCEDEALEVDFLPKDEQPGTHVRRINGVDEVDDDKLLSRWEEIVAKVPEGKRTGRWHIAYCLAMPNGQLRTVSRNHEVLFFSPSSKIRLPGWPMSSLEGSVRFGKPSSEQTAEEKALSKNVLTEKIREGFRDLISGGTE
jgi:inosine/xanthosine triphosphate pyrophosphatase family protein